METTALANLCSPVLKILQWGSEYSTSLVFKWSKWGRAYCPIIKCHLNTGQMDAITQMVCLVQRIKYKDQLFEILTLKILEFKYFQYLNGRHSDPHCNWLIIDSFIHLYNYAKAPSLHQRKKTKQNLVESKSTAKCNSTVGARKSNVFSIRIVVC